MLELNDNFQQLGNKEKRKARIILLYDPKNTRVKCLRCNLVFILHSDKYNTHMLFRHGVYVPTCGSKQRKRLEDNCIQGLLIRPAIRIQKSRVRVDIRNRKMNLWNTRGGKILKFFNSLDVKILPYINIIEINRSAWI